MIRLQKLPDETVDEFLTRVAMTAPVPTGDVMERLRQLLPPAPLPSAASRLERAS